MLYKVKIRWLTWPLNNIALPWESLRFLLIYPLGQVILCFGLWYPMVQVILSSIALLWSCCFFLTTEIIPSLCTLVIFCALLGLLLGCCWGGQSIHLFQKCTGLIVWSLLKWLLSNRFTLVSQSKDGLLYLNWYLFISSSISMKNTNSTLVVVYGGKAAKCVFVQNKTMDPIKEKVWTCNLSLPLSQLSSVASTAFFMTGRNSEVSRVSRRFAGPRCILLSHNSTTRRNCHKGKVCSKSPRRRADTAWETPAKAMCSCVLTDVEHLLKVCQVYLPVDI